MNKDLMYTLAVIIRNQAIMMYGIAPALRKNGYEAMRNAAEWNNDLASKMFDILDGEEPHEDSDRCSDSQAE